MLKRLIIVLAVLALTFISTFFLKEAPQYWSQENVSGLKLSLDHPNNLLEYDFTSDGHVIASIGTKTGPVAAPVFEWKLTNGKLKVEGMQFSQEYFVISRTYFSILVRNQNGEEERFSIRWF